MPKVKREHGGRAHRRQFRRIAWNDFRGMLKGTAFMIVAGIGLVNMFFGLAFSTSLYENEILPVTYHVVDMMRGSFDLFTMILIVFYSGLLVWKEREPKLDEVHDATPVPLGLGLAGKYTALVMLLAVLLVGSAFGGMLFQLVKGYTRLEPGVYLGMYILPGLVSFSTMAALSFLVHVLVNNKYVGYGVFIAVMFLPGILWNALDVNTNLVSFGGAPGITYSDMNAYGTALKGWLWFKAYWWAFALLLLLLSMAFWVRGKETGVPQRMRAAVARLKRNRRLVWPALALWVGLGAWSYYNTKVLNEVPKATRKRTPAYYEKTYKKY
ncbi:MAG: hypothetical protein IPO79_11895 [Flavobacteriales bacterium]|nr:hypothetical protein [Flavobacteriales bacterium]